MRRDSPVFVLVSEEDMKDKLPHRVQGNGASRASSLEVNKPEMMNSSISLTTLYGCIVCASHGFRHIPPVSYMRTPSAHSF